MAGWRGIRTAYPEKLTPAPDQPEVFWWVGTPKQNSNATLDLAKVCGTAEWGDNVWVRVEVEYEFDQSPNITVGQFVDTNLENRWQASFHYNSGVIFEDRVEIQIFDTASLLTAIGGTQITLDGEVVNVKGNPDDINGTEEVPPDLQNPAKVKRRHTNSEGRGRRRGQGPPGLKPVCLRSAVRSAGFIARSKKERKRRDRRGETLFIDARKLGKLIDRVHRELTDD